MKNKEFVLSRYSPGTSIFVEHTGWFKSYSPQTNDCFLAAYIAHGTGAVNIGSISDAVFEGDIFLIRPNTEYKFIPSQGLRRIDVYCCYFSIDALGTAVRDFIEHFPEGNRFFELKASFLHAVDSENKDIRDVYIQMIDEQFSQHPCSHNIIAGYLPVLLTKLLRNVKTHNFKRVYSNNSTVDDAIRFIHERLYSKVSLEDISDHLKVSPSYVCRLFKKHVGITTAQFINMLRVEKMKDILRHTAKRADTIPDMFGCDADYLKLLFKRETGMTMKEYQNKYNYMHNPSDKE